MNTNTEKDKALNIIITGVGGQGNVTLSRLIGEMVINDDNYVTIGETFGASQRGGSVMSHIRISRKGVFSPLIPANNADLIIGLEPAETIRVLAEYGNWKVFTISNTWQVMPSGVLSGDFVYPDIQQISCTIKNLSNKAFLENFTEMGMKMGHHFLSNSIITGLASGLGIIKEINEKSFTSTIKKYYTKDSAKKNIEAFHIGLDLSKSPGL